jgi:hypothetical protein
MKNLYYYKLHEAENIKKAFASWIGKEAHIGKGLKEKLTAIHLKPKREYKHLKRQSNFYRVEFEFETQKIFSAHEFFFHNSLIPLAHNPFISSATTNKK